ncbi:mevalonate kinase [Terrilactibacillus sp. BCM23-1]|uniref:Mevalonate kinase n=1 Tax=Terrilactibacillus tamarindi TaxID=2599694 RepID=A0A6N8CP20_9BACI|nr:mevalonate kinase [Terrilactibacillus tamarindi]MTT31388.1 mevalonate kinase [Terrilactibacillus tamarindi]
MTKIDVGIGTSSSKVILIGEHSVVYGQPAIAMPVPAARAVTETTGCQGAIQLHCAFYDGILSESPDKIAGLKKIIPVTLQVLHKPEENIAVSIDSTIPVERGMGSSAAIAISVVRSLFDYFKTPLDQKTLLRLVGISEKCCHGNPSGLDATAASGSRPIYFTREKGPEWIKQTLRSCLVIADTGIKGETKKAVAALKQRWTQGLSVQSKIEKLGFLASHARKALESAKEEQFGRILLDAHHLLRELGVSHPFVDQLVHIAMTGGAIGAKMTGGGCGGCMIALAPNEHTAKHLAAKLMRAGAHQTWIQPFGDEMSA